MKSFTPFAQSFFLKKASSRKLTGQVAVFGQVLHFLLGFKVWWETCEKGENPEKCVRGNTGLIGFGIRW